MKKVKTSFAVPASVLEAANELSDEIGLGKGDLVTLGLVTLVGLSRSVLHPGKNRTRRLSDLEAIVQEIFAKAQSGLILPAKK